MLPFFAYSFKKIAAPTPSGKASNSARPISIVVDTKAGASVVCALPLSPNIKSILKCGKPFTKTNITINARTNATSKEITQETIHSASQALPVRR